MGFSSASGSGPAMNDMTVPKESFSRMTGTSCEIRELPLMVEWNQGFTLVTLGGLIVEGGNARNRSVVGLPVVGPMGPLPGNSKGFGIAATLSGRTDSAAFAFLELLALFAL